MKSSVLLLTVALVAVVSWSRPVPIAGQAPALTAPAFHHLHLNTVNPDAALAFYTKAFPSTSRTTWGGLPALKSPDNVLVLFTRVEMPPPTRPQTAMWHFGWAMTSERQTFDRFKREGITVMPLYITGEGGSVAINSDSWPGTGGAAGLTKEQIVEAKAKGVKPLGGGGFGFARGPDEAMIEFSGDSPTERFSHVHMYQEEPFCAQLWYQRHLSASLPKAAAGAEARTDANCKVPRGPRSWPSADLEGTARTPAAGVLFSGVALNWYPNPGDQPLVSTRGQVVDHVAVSVADLDAWLTKLRAEKVTVLEAPYRLGDTRAALLEGPSKEAIELVEVK